MLGSSLDGESKAAEWNAYLTRLLLGLDAIGKRQSSQEILVLALFGLLRWPVGKLNMMLPRNSEMAQHSCLRLLTHEGRLVMTHLDELHDQQQTYRALENATP